MYIYINTTKSDTVVGLLDKKCSVISSYVWEGGQNQSETLITEIDKLLSANKIKGNNLTGIIVANGTGSYTGVRVGVASANSLALSWDIPIWGIVDCDITDRGTIQNAINLKSNIPIVPKYQNLPHITQKKNRQKI